MRRAFQTFFNDSAALMSPRTAKYVEAMVREGFDFNEWLKEVREEEAGATSTSGELAAAEIDRPISTPDNQHVRVFPALRLATKTIWVPRALRLHCQPKSKTPKARLTHWLKKVRRASGEFQKNRSRDAVYDYLESVFAIVEHYRVRRRTHRLLRHAFKFADLPFDKNADAFTAVLRCTSKRDIDIKSISKWARALRFAAACKGPQTSLKRFIKRAGGINACGARYARLHCRGAINRRGRRRLGRVD